MASSVLRSEATFRAKLDELDLLEFASKMKELKWNTIAGFAQCKDHNTENISDADLMDAIRQITGFDEATHVGPTPSFVPAFKWLFSRCSQALLADLRAEFCDTPRVFKPIEINEREARRNDLKEKAGKFR
jgi:hypothetical protein